MSKFLAGNNYDDFFSCFLVLGYIPMGKNNPFMDKRLNFPREIQLPFSTSWQVSGQSFVKDPFLGSGPSTYLFNFTAYKPAEFNASKFWNLRFDQAFNEYLQILGTLGSLGFLAFFSPPPPPSDFCPLGFFSFLSFSSAMTALAGSGFRFRIQWALR